MTEGDSVGRPRNSQGCTLVRRNVCRLVLRLPRVRSALTGLAADLAEARATRLEPTRAIHRSQRLSRSALRLQRIVMRLLRQGRCGQLVRRRLSSMVRRWDDAFVAGPRSPGCGTGPCVAPCAAAVRRVQRQIPGRPGMDDPVAVSTPGWGYTKGWRGGSASTASSSTRRYWPWPMRSFTTRPR